MQHRCTCHALSATRSMSQGFQTLRRLRHRTSVGKICRKGITYSTRERTWQSKSHCWRLCLSVCLWMAVIGLCSARAQTQIIVSDVHCTPGWQDVLVLAPCHGFPNAPVCALLESGALIESAKAIGWPGFFASDGLDIAVYPTGMGGSRAPTKEVGGITEEDKDGGHVGPPCMELRVDMDEFRYIYPTADKQLYDEQLRGGAPMEGIDTNVVGTGIESQASRALPLVQPVVATDPHPPDPLTLNITCEDASDTKVARTHGMVDFAGRGAAWLALPARNSEGAREKPTHFAPPRLLPAARRADVIWTQTPGLYTAQLNARTTSTRGRLLTNQEPEVPDRRRRRFRMQQGITIPSGLSPLTLNPGIQLCQLVRISRALTGWISFLATAFSFKHTLMMTAVSLSSTF